VSQLLIARADRPAAWRSLPQIVAGIAEIPLFWRLQLTFWTVLSVFGLVSRILIYRDVWTALALAAFLEPVAILLTCWLRWRYGQIGISSMPEPRAILRIAGLCVLAATVQIGMAALGRAAFGWRLPDGNMLFWLLLPFGYYLTVFVSWSLLQFWILASRTAAEQHARAAAAETAALRAELDQLRLQLDPHLIFNTLNGIAVEIPERPDTALGMLHDLADYLRSSLRTPLRAISTVAAEVEAIRAYLAIQQARFGDRLACELRIDPQALPSQLPSFVLQLLVENAIKHGLRCAPKALTVTVEATVCSGMLWLVVRNDGVLAAGPGARDSGIGLANLTRRLALHYPDRHRFALQQRGSEVVAELRLEGQPCFA
jgi:two-component system LytT family sensor kinase